MRLKQKFFNIYTSYYKKSNELDKMVEVADEFAIEFAIWLFNKNFYKSETFEYDRLFLSKSEKYLDGSGKIYFCDELLEIFKKEKGL